jgi:cytochrome c-type biogenesis protein CcmH/NrfF
MTSNRLTAILAASVLVAASLLGTGARAFTLEEFQFASPAQEQQFRDLIGKLR